MKLFSWAVDMLEAEVIETDKGFLVGYWLEEDSFYVLSEFENEGLAYVYAARFNSVNSIH